MTLEDTYRYKTWSASEALKLQAEEHLSEFAPLEGDRPVRPVRRDTLGSDQIEYRSKGPVRDLELMFEADEDEI